MPIPNEIIRMLQNHDVINQLCDIIHNEIYHNTTDDWVDIKHMPIDDACMAMDFDDIKKIVNEYGVLEVMDLIRSDYGDEFITDLMEKTMDMRYRTLFYHILNGYIDYLKFENNWGDTDDEEEEEEEEEEDVDSDTASDADTDEEN